MACFLARNVWCASEGQKNQRTVLNHALIITVNNYYSIYKLYNNLDMFFFNHYHNHAVLILNQVDIVNNNYYDNYFK